MEVEEDLRLQEMRRNASYYYMRYLSTESHDWQSHAPPLVPWCDISESDYVAFYTAGYEQRLAPVRLSPGQQQQYDVTAYDREKGLITIRHTATGGQLDIMFENQVYVVRFCDKYTKRRYLFNLKALAQQLAACGVEYSTNKFAKITLRYRDGPSHLFFASGRLLETGTYSAAIARKSLDHTLALLRDRCHYGNLEIGRRRCENIVAKGSVKFEICLLVLCDTYPWCATYSGDFVGAIIRMRRLHHTRQQRQQQSCSTRLCSDDDEAEEEAEDEDADDDDNAGYEFLEEKDNVELYNTGFDQYVVPEKKEGDLFTVTEEEDEGPPSSSASTRRRAPLLGNVMRNPEEMEEAELDEVARGARKNNVTIIVFEKGKIICAGCKTERSVIASCARILPMLEACKKTPRNMERERQLQQRS